MPKLLRTLVVVSILILAGGLWCREWGKSHGAFSDGKLDIPLSIKAGSQTDLVFSVSEKGTHYIEIRYPQDRSYDVPKALNALTGTCVLRTEDRILASTDLPTQHIVGGNESAGTVIATFKGSPSVKYTLILNINSLPTQFQRVAPTLRIELDPNYYKILPISVWLGLWLTVIGSFLAIITIGLTMIRWLRS